MSLYYSVNFFIILGDVITKQKSNGLDPSTRFDIYKTNTHWISHCYIVKNQKLTQNINGRLPDSARHTYDFIIKSISVYGALLDAYFYILSTF